MEKPTRCYVAEFVGTFTLVFVGTAVATLQGMLDRYGPTGWLSISFAFGFTLMVLVWVVGPISGCHVNPAVTIAMAVAGRLERNRVLGYFIGQFAGALVASSLLLILLKGLPNYEVQAHGLGANGNPQNMWLGSLFLWEFIMTALFLFTIFAATRADAPAGFAGLAIGGFLFVAHLVGAPLGDASLNPARSFGPAVLVGGSALKVLWLFFVAPILGGLLGWAIYTKVYEE